MAGKKCSKVEADRRVHAVYRFLQEFKSRTWILQHISDEWGLSQRSGEIYIAKARELMQQDFQMERKDLAAQVLSAYLAVYKKALEQNQLSNTIGALAGISRLTGIEQKPGRGSK